MFKILQINTVVGIGSTGRIAENIGDYIIKKGSYSTIGYGRKVGISNSKLIKIGNHINILFNVIQTRLFDRHALNPSYFTNQFIKKIIKFNPDIIHLHNIHGYYINYKTLFDFLFFYNKPVVWTIHDCWPITGHCTFFDNVHCDKWKIQCDNCIQKTAYPKSFFKDNSYVNYNDKRNLFTKLDKLYLVAPSNWMKQKIQESFLNSAKLDVINNGININLFKPETIDKATFYNGLFKNKYVLIAVALQWDERKGLSDLIKLSDQLKEDEILLIIGLIPNKIKNILPTKIINISNINNPKLLNSFYSISDIFINPTKADNYPTTNLEAISAGLPVIMTSTGGNLDFMGFESVKFYEQGQINMIRNNIDFIRTKGVKYFENISRNIATTQLSSDIQNSLYWNLYTKIIK